MWPLPTSCSPRSRTSERSSGRPSRARPARPFTACGHWRRAARQRSGRADGKLQAGTSGLRQQDAGRPRGRADVTEETTAAATRQAASAGARDGGSAHGASGSSGTSQAGPAGPAPGQPADIREARDQVTVSMPAEGAYLSVLRTATAGLAARLDFTLDEIEDLRIAVDEAC